MIMIVPSCAFTGVFTHVHIVPVPAFENSTEKRNTSPLSNTKRALFCPLSLYLHQLHYLIAVDASLSLLGRDWEGT